MRIESHIRTESVEKEQTKNKKFKQKTHSRQQTKQEHI